MIEDILKSGTCTYNPNDYTTTLRNNNILKTSTFLKESEGFVLGGSGSQILVKVLRLLPATKKEPKMKVCSLL